MRPIKKPKTKHDVRGCRERCVNYQMCPLCYGCRRFNSLDPECLICLHEDKKKNICNKDLHRDEITAKMITKNNIVFDEVSFQNYSEERTND